MMTTNLERELKNVDLQKGKTRIGAHLCLLLGIDPKTTEVPELILGAET